MKVIGLDTDGTVICFDPLLAEEDDRFPDGVYNCGETLQEFGWLTDEEKVNLALQGIIRLARVSVYGDVCSF